MIKEFERNLENVNQNDSLFFYLGDCPAKLKINYKGENFKILAVVDGDKRVYKNDERIDLDIADLYNSDEELNKDIEKDILEIENNNWFSLIIIDKDEKEYETEEIIYSLKELKELTDEEIKDLIEKNVK